MTRTLKYVAVRERGHILPYLSFSPKNQRGRILVDTPLYVTAYVGAHSDVLDASGLWGGETQQSMPPQALKTILRQAKV